MAAGTYFGLHHPSVGFRRRRRIQKIEQQDKGGGTAMLENNNSSAHVTVMEYLQTSFFFLSVVLQITGTQTEENGAPMKTKPTCQVLHVCADRGCRQSSQSKWGGTAAPDGLIPDTGTVKEHLCTWMLNCLSRLWHQQLNCCYAKNRTSGDLQQYPFFLLKMKRYWIKMNCSVQNYWRLDKKLHISSEKLIT